MTKSSIIPCVLMAAALVAEFFHPFGGNVVIFVTAALLYGLSLYLERARASEFESLRKDLEALRGRVDSLTMARGLGR